MKVLRSTDWEPVGYSESFTYLDGKPVFFFQHKTYQDLVALKAAKYVDVANNIVFFFDSLNRKKVSVSGGAGDRVDPSAINKLLMKCGL